MIAFLLWIVFFGFRVSFVSLSHTGPCFWILFEKWFCAGVQGGGGEGM